MEKYDVEDAVRRLFGYVLVLVREDQRLGIPDRHRTNRGGALVERMAGLDRFFPGDVRLGDAGRVRGLYTAARWLLDTHDQPAPARP